jgi:RNA polymerase sigma-70 factor (ECF subfamily)
MKVQTLRSLSRTPHEEIIPTRITLLLKMKNPEDSASWQDFYNTYRKLIYGYAMRYGLNEAEADEVLQETVIEVFKRIGEFNYDPTKSFKAWLLKNTWWRVQDQLRKRKHSSRLPTPTDEPERSTDLINRIPDPHGNELDPLWEDEWQKNLLSLAIDRLKTKIKPKQYQIFDLYVLKEWTPEKVAETFGVSTGQVYLSKFRIMRMLKKELHELESVGPDGLQTRKLAAGE